MPKDLYCWRCDRVLPMLDEDEWVRMAPLLDASIGNIKRYRRNHGIALEAVPIAQMYWSALEMYRTLTGFEETNPKALWHHRLALFGPPCANCGKPLRTPRAKLCVACGTPREREA